MWLRQINKSAKILVISLHKLVLYKPLNLFLYHLLGRYKHILKYLNQFSLEGSIGQSLTHLHYLYYGFLKGRGIGKYSLIHSFTHSFSLSFPYSHSHTLIPILSFLYSHSHTLIPILSFPYSHSYTLIPILSFPYSRSYTLVPILSFLYSHSHTLIPILSFPYSHSYTLSFPHSHSYTCVLSILSCTIPSLSSSFVFSVVNWSRPIRLIFPRFCSFPCLLREKEKT